ncbi:MAG: hypothetical protein HY291_11560 [Planctomycetes bacterium]|nr:hypothetical protein [Planctomycetota bacterium]
MKIGLIAPSRHREAARLQKALEARAPGCAIRLNLDFSEDDRTALDATQTHWNGVDLAQLDAVLLMGFAYCDPVIPSPSLHQDWGVWRYDYLAEQQTYSYFHSLFQDLERRGVRVLNAPDVHMSCFARPALFERLRIAGLDLPETLCTNRMESVRAFTAGRQTVVWRPATGRSIWQLFRDAQREALIAFNRPPIMIADVKAGPLVRAYVLNGQALMFLAFDYPHDGPPERLESFWEIEIEEARPALARLAELVAGRWLEVQFIFAEGKVWIYDVDADPATEALPAVLQERLANRLAASLLGMPAEAPVLGEPPRERQTMFLRRMLRILFEFEESKYS